ncbi:hypothetical protein C8F01DRAFT_1087269 [Mycena amicta]|nr:hypothetical protein C8F01DRAFT_1087269 [Mycena amicta]
MILTPSLAFLLPLFQLVFFPLYSLGSSHGSAPIGAIIGGVAGALGLIILFCVLRCVYKTTNRHPRGAAIERMGMHSVSRSRTLDEISILDRDVPAPPSPAMVPTAAGAGVGPGNDAVPPPPYSMNIQVPN